MKTIRFERQSGGIEEVECESFALSPGGLECLRSTNGNSNCGIPLLYLHYAVPACDVRWVEEVIPAENLDVEFKHRSYGLRKDGTIGPDCEE
mgnify:CR=1 FL=1